MNQQTSIDHGEMMWTGEFDEDNYAIFQCSQCSRRFGRRPGANGHRSYDSGAIIGEDGSITVAKHWALLHLGLFPLDEMEQRWGTVMAPDLFDRLESDPEFQRVAVDLAQSFEMDVEVSLSHD